MSTLAGKVITITGAGSGIGLATAEALLARGALVSICDMNDRTLQETLTSLSHHPKINILSSQVDIRDRAAVRSFLQNTKFHFGRLDGCANVAGVRGKWSNIWDTSTEEYERIMDTNAKGVFNFLAEALAPGLMNTSGSIVNVSSTWGSKGLTQDAPYTASKHAINGLTKSAAKEAGPRGIRVNAVAPGAVMTPMLDKPDAAFTSPIPRAGDPEEIANVICFLLARDSSFITGAVHTVDGGATC